MKYTKETLAAINDRYLKIGHHWINSDDVAKANAFVELIESTRSTETPKPGDILQYTDKYGEYFSHAHIEKFNLHCGGNICEHPYVPFISAKKDGIACFTSGGAWTDIPLSELKYVGKEIKSFCFWGSCGACADGAIEIEAEVSVWEYTHPNPETPGYTTKEYDRFWISDSGIDSRYTKESGYQYHISRNGTSCNGFKDILEFNAWLKTFKGKVFDRGSACNMQICWTYRQLERHVSPEEFDAIPEPIDTMVFNGAVRKCKRIYDDAAHTVTTCFVWYWDTAQAKGDEFYRLLESQNKIRKERYTLPWGTPAYAVAKGIVIGKGGDE